MASSGRTLHGAKIGCALPMRAPRKTCLSPRSFQEHVRNETNLFFPSSRNRRLHEAADAYKKPHELLRRQQGSATIRRGNKPHNSSAAYVSFTKSTHQNADEFNRTELGSAALRDDVKLAMRLVAQPVAVVTSVDSAADVTGGAKGWRGATISSFNTVTLYPYPVVSFNIKKISSTFDAIQHSARFRVHFLCGNDSAIELAQQFTKGNASSPFSDVRGSQPQTKAEGKSRIPPKIEGLRTHGGKSVLFSVDCLYNPEKTVTVGDHVVLFGKVVSVDDAPHMRQDPDKSEPCLVYADGQYHVLKAGSTILTRQNNIRREDYVAFLNCLLYSEHASWSRRNFTIPFLPSEIKMKISPFVRSIRKVQKAIVEAVKETKSSSEMDQQVLSQSLIDIGQYIKIFLSPRHLDPCELTDIRYSTQQLLEKYNTSSMELMILVDDINLKQEQHKSRGYRRSDSPFFSLQKSCSTSINIAVSYLENYWLQRSHHVFLDTAAYIQYHVSNSTRECRSRLLSVINSHNKWLLDTRTEMTKRTSNLQRDQDSAPSLSARRTRFNQNPEHETVHSLHAFEYRLRASLRNRKIHVSKHLFEDVPAEAIHALRVYREHAGNSARAIAEYLGISEERWNFYNVPRPPSREAEFLLWRPPVEEAKETAETENALVQAGLRTIEREVHKEEAKATAFASTQTPLTKRQQLLKSARAFDDLFEDRVEDEKSLVTLSTPTLTSEEMNKKLWNREDDDLLQELRLAMKNLRQG